MKGKTKLAEVTLVNILGKDEAKKRVEEISSSSDNDTKITWSSLLINGKVAPILWVGIGLAAFQQLTGINVVFYYSNTLWQAVGFSEQQAFITSMICNFVAIPIGVLTAFVIDKLGRRVLLLGGTVGMFILLALLSSMFWLVPKSAEGLPMLGSWAPLAIIATVFYIALFGMSWGPVMWVLLGEIFPNRMRGSALAVCGLVQWISNWLVTATFPILLAKINLGPAYGIYTLFALLAIIFVFRYVKETKGKELEDMTGQIS